MTFTIKQKLIFAYTLVFGIVLVIFAFIIYQSIKQNEIERIDSSIKSYSVVLQSEIEEQVSDEKNINLDELKQVKAEGLQDVKLALYDTHGNNLLSDSIAVDEDKWKSAIRNSDFTGTVITPSGENYRSYWSGVECNGRIEYALRIMASLKGVDNSLSRLLVIMCIIIPFALLITGLAAWLISKAAFKPVIRMSQTAREITAKSLDKRLELPSAKDEIFYLGNTLNEMISRLDSSFRSHRQFISDASHEIRTPLTILQTELELLQNNLNDSADKDSIRTALLEIESLSKLTTSLLTLAKLDSSQHSLNLEEIRLDELLIESIQFMKKAAGEKNISLELHLTEPVQICADKDKLKSVFINLMDNAVKYSLDNSAVRIIMEQASGNVIIKFVNFGILIRPSEINNIFERFYRSSEVQSKIKGNGLGLTIAREFVELHKGAVSAESSEKSGTIFTVELPV